jgi:HD superfamily phosphodiesterase
MQSIIIQYAKDMCAGRLARGFDHVNRVYHLAKHLEDEYDDEVLFAATYLHDIILTEPHQLQSAEKAEAVLHEVGFEPGKIMQVKEAILNHIPEGDPKSTESKMLHDADILDSLGMSGIARLAIGAFFWRGAKSLVDVLRHIREYKERAESHLILDRSRQLARDKIEFMEKALDQLEKELSIVEMD